MRQCVGAARFAYNWGVAVGQRYYCWFKKTVSWMRLVKKWYQVKRCVARLSWAQGVSKIVTSTPFAYLGRSYNRFHESLKRRKAGLVTTRVNPPKFKKKSTASRSFCIADEGRLIKFKDKTVGLPGIGWVRYRSTVRWPNAIRKRATIIEKAGKWFLVVQFELPELNPEPHTGPTAGIDLGCTVFATISSEGRVVDEVKPPKPLAKAKRRLKRLQRSLNRKVKGGKNRHKAIKRIGLLFLRIANRRNDFLNKLSRRVVNDFSLVGLENLHVHGLMQTFVRSTATDLGLGEFRRQVEYKAAETGCRIVIASRYFPSTKTCSVCGLIEPSVRLGVKQWTCDACGTQHQRDHNAAINLEQLARGTRDVTKPVETGVPAKRKPSRSRSVKQEIS